MLIISSREFRQNQKYYLDMIDNNQQIIVQRGKNKAYKIEPVRNEDSVISEIEFIEKINASLKQADDGKLIELTKAKQSEILRT